MSKLRKDPIYVRASVWPRCDLTCTYCPVAEGMENRTPDRLLSLTPAGRHHRLNVGQYGDDVQGMGRGFHDVALYQVPHGLAPDYRQRAGMNHLALRLATPAEVDAAAETLRAAGVKLLKGPLTHKEDNDRYLYLEDPDGNVIELVSSTLPNWPAAYLRAPPCAAFSPC